MAQLASPMVSQLSGAGIVAGGGTSACAIGRATRSAVVVAVIVASKAAVAEAVVARWPP